MARGKKTGGRVKGTPNKITTDLRGMVLGALDGVGGEDYLQRQARRNPVAFIGLVGKCLPKDIKIGGELVLEVNLIGKRGQANG